MTYRLICDSCTDLPPEVLQDPHITKVPLSIQVGAETVVDDESFRQKELLQKMRAWPDAPKTACPSPSTYLERLIEDGDNYIVTLSAALSGSYNAAAQALAIYREEGGRANVHVFNSRSAVSGQAQIALLVRDLAGAGLPFAQVVEQAEAYISRMQTLFVLENLDNLRKNGRLTKVQALVTGALRVKLLCGATRGGEIERLGQGLSVRQTLARMVSRMAADPDHAGRRLIITHCNCPERAEHVRELVRQRCQFGEILIAPAGGIATVYADDGGIVVAY
ncbi:MAG: DegV family protein [Oscillospiraceae bacterium]|jgi:DegV family protein with EDD domain|nr:DegV family protein [Oscillospiraceae bacterium]MCI9390765.1 DegV family protein [Oscillospiraceae bacterium]